MHALITNSNQSAATNRSDIQLDITGRNTTAGQHISFSNKSQRLRQILYAPFCQPAPTSATITGTALVFDRHMPLFQKPEQCTLSFTGIPELPAAGGETNPIPLIHPGQFLPFLPLTGTVGKNGYFQGRFHQSLNWLKSSVLTSESICPTR